MTIIRLNLLKQKTLTTEESEIKRKLFMLHNSRMTQY